MAVPRDPAFWKRFSMAVHMDEEKGAPEYRYVPELPRRLQIHKYTDKSVTATQRLMAPTRTEEEVEADLHLLDVLDHLLHLHRRDCRHHYLVIEVGCAG